EEEEIDISNLEDGKYTFAVSHLHSEEDKDSSMARYLGDDVYVEVKDGKAHITVNVNDTNTVTLLKVLGKEAETTYTNEDKSFQTFALDELTDELAAYVEYEAPFNGGVHKGKADFRMKIDVE